MTKQEYEYYHDHTNIYLTFNERPNVEFIGQFLLTIFSTPNAIIDWEILINYIFNTKGSSELILLGSMKHILIYIGRERIRRIGQMVPLNFFVAFHY